MQVAFSKTIAGVGSVAGGTYWCAQGNVNTAQSACEGKPELIVSSQQINQAKLLASQGAIDPLSNLAGRPMYIYASPLDTIINPGNSDKLTEFLTAFNDPSNISQQHLIESAHGFPTLNQGGLCEMPMSPWILDCAYDTAGVILETMYGVLNFRGVADPSHLHVFSQTDFGNAQTPLYATGWIYVPDSCAKGQTCKLHVALHGCEMNPDYIQDQFASITGYNEWAETNNTIILYPQSAKIGTVDGDPNPYACWDWYGFTGENYVTQSGSQMAALKKMIERVQGL
jgi:Esterase PHB depolymerase